MRKAPRILRSTQNTRASYNPPPPPSLQSYWGAWIGKQWTGTDVPNDWFYGNPGTAYTQFRDQCVGGKDLSLINWSTGWFVQEADPRYPDVHVGDYLNFKTDHFERIRQNGSYSLFSWGHQERPYDIPRGVYDDYIQRWGHDAAAWGHPFFLRYNWEMNATWLTWGVGNGANGPPNTAAEYIADWRYVHDMLAAEGCTPTWVFCPNYNNHYNTSDPVEPYPGAAYVDWLALDVYNSTGGYGGWHTFSTLAQADYDALCAAAPGKPFVFCEIGCEEDPNTSGRKAQWITDMFTNFDTTMTNVRAFLWFEDTINGQWQIETSPSSINAFTAGVGATKYVENVVGAATTKPIPPLA